MNILFFQQALGIYICISAGCLAIGIYGLRNNAQRPASWSYLSSALGLLVISIILISSIASLMSLVGKGSSADIASINLYGTIAITSLSIVSGGLGVNGLFAWIMAKPKSSEI